MKPVRMEFDVGLTRHKQRLRLVFEQSYDGHWEWTLRKEAAGQRDDTQIISGIQPESLLQMAEAVRAVKP